VKCLIALLCIGLFGCANPPLPLTYARPADLRTELRADADTLRTLRPSLDELDREFAALRESGDWRNRGYLSVEETNQIAALLFRFVTAHSALWKITAAYQSPQTPFDDPVLETKAYVLSHQASLLLASHSAFLVAEFAKDPIATAKMNEAFYRLEIPTDSYYSLAAELTPERLSRLARAGALAARERADATSELTRLENSNARYAILIDLNAALQTIAEERIQVALEKKGSSQPEILHATKESIDNGLYVARSILFKDVSRLKSPTAHLIRFSDAQKAEVYEKLSPGDVILTYTAGYTSDVFIPGAFKHGITYVGSPAQREGVGLRTGALPDVAPDVRDQIATNLAQANLEGGRPADMIEAVAEGVIFNNLAHIMDTHINRMLVLRPRLSASERTDFLIEVFSYLGEEYDFRFDFADSTRQVCTEVIYRAIQGKAGIDFELTVRAGHVTLSADDVVHYFLSEKPESFQFVLYAEEDPESKDHQARIVFGDPGVSRLSELMKGVGE
jgi:hypothetical protein